MLDKNVFIKKALIAEYVSIGFGILEAMASIWFGVIAGSIALVGFGLDSVIEVAAAAMLVWRLVHRGDARQEDRKEKKALRFIGMTFFLLAIYILYESSGKLTGQEKPQSSVPGIIITILSAVSMMWLGTYKRKIAKAIGSLALEADAMETCFCSYLSFATLLGLSLNALMGWWWADPVAALVMVYFLVREGWEAIMGKECGCGKCAD